MKIVCDKCEEIVDKDASCEISVEFPFRIRNVGKDLRYYVCQPCGEEAKKMLKKFMRDESADSQEC